MGGKVKMRCGRCGKPFKSASAKQTLCDACEAKARAARAASRTQAAKPAAGKAPAPVPKIVGPGAAILGVVPTPTAAVSVPPEHDHVRFERREPQEQRHDARDARPTSPARGQAPAQRSSESHAPRAATPPKEPKQQQPQQPPKQPRPPAPAVELTGELRARIEQRYTELAQPVEFDGIRTQIAAELGIPKPLVKRAVLDLRTRTQTPSWWEVQAFTGAAADLERIRQAYVPHLPVPPVGIHKQIAAGLHLEPMVVYRAIRRLRAEMHLPQFNPPELHADDTAPVLTTPESTEASPADARQA